MPYSAERISRLSTQQIEELVSTSLRELARRADPQAFQSLLVVSGEVGVCLGASARLLAESGSWSQVAEMSGTTKQAAWSRWAQH
jgi:hypothetical protein